MSDVVIGSLDRANSHSDLCETSLDEALRLTPKYNSELILIVSECDTLLAGRLAEKLGIGRVISLPCQVFGRDAWCLVGEFSGFYSEGA